METKLLKHVDENISELSRRPIQSTSSILKEHQPNKNLKFLSKLKLTMINVHFSLTSRPFRQF